MEPNEITSSRSVAIVALVGASQVPLLPSELSVIPSVSAAISSEDTPTPDILTRVPEPLSARRLAPRVKGCQARSRWLDVFFR